MGIWNSSYRERRESQRSRTSVILFPQLFTPTLLCFWFCFGFFSTETNLLLCLFCLLENAAHPAWSAHLAPHHPHSSHCVNSSQCLVCRWGQQHRSMVQMHNK